MGNEKCERAKRHAQKTTNKQRQTDNRDTESSSTYVTNKLTNKNKRNETRQGTEGEGKGKRYGAQKPFQKYIRRRRTTNRLAGFRRTGGWVYNTTRVYFSRKKKKCERGGGKGIVVPWQEQGKWMNGWMNGSEGGAGRKMDGRATNEGTCDNLYRTS